MESVITLFPGASCFTSLYLLYSMPYLLFPENDWLILLLKLLLISYFTANRSAMSTHARLHDGYNTP